MNDSCGTREQSFRDALWKQTKEYLFYVKIPLLQSYYMPLLGSFEKLVWFVAPLFWIVQFTTTSSYYSLVGTADYFTSSVSSGYLYVNDTLLDGYTAYNYSQLVTVDDEDSLFITTKYTVEIQNLTTSSTPGYSEWETTQETTVYVPLENLTLMDLEIVARIECHGNVFSNFDRNDPSTNKFYKLNVGWLLDSVGVSKCGGISNPSNPYLNCCETSCPYAGYAYYKGLDMSVIYNWRCDLNKYSDTRYLCAYDNLEVDFFKLSSSSLVDRVVYYDLAYDETMSSSALRKKLTLVGFKVRLRALGGCYRPTVEGVTDILAQGYVLYKLSAIFATCLVVYATYRSKNRPFVKFVQNEVFGDWAMRPTASQAEVERPKVRESDAIEITDASTPNALNTVTVT